MLMMFFILWLLLSYASTEQLTAIPRAGPTHLTMRAPLLVAFNNKSAQVNGTWAC